MYSHPIVELTEVGRLHERASRAFEEGLFPKHKLALVLSGTTLVAILIALILVTP